MVNGFFLGGAAEGMQKQDALNIQQQAEDRTAKNAQIADADKQIATMMGEVSSIMKAAADAGHDPQTLLQNGTVKAYLASAQGLAARVGRDPNKLEQQVQLMALRPVAGSTSLGSASPDGVQPSAAPVDAPAAVPAQPVLGSPDTLSPRQIQVANPLMSQPAPVQPGLASPVQATPAAPIAPVQDSTNQPPNFAQRFAANEGAASDAPAQTYFPRMPPDLPPGDKAIDYAINNKVMGSEFLKALPPVARNVVQDVADYKVPLEAASKRKDGQTTLASWVHQYTNGDYDSKWFKPMQATLKEFTSGGSTSPASQIQVGNTAIAHAGTVADAIDGLAAVPGLLAKIGKSDTPIVSYVANALKNEAIKGTSEGRALSAFSVASHHYVDETTKYYAGGQPAEGGRIRSLDDYNAAKSASELYSALHVDQELMNGKVGALQDRWKNSMAGPKGFGDKLIRNAIPDFPLISETSKTAIERVTKGYLATKFNAISSSGPAIPASGGDGWSVQRVQ